MKRDKKHDEAGLLFLRLPEDETQPVWWRLASSEEKGSGSVAAGATDPRLAGLLSRYPARVLVPAGKIAFHHVRLPQRTRRQRLHVLPFLLEEHLATDIDKLHFAILHQTVDMCDVAVVEKSVMQRWLAYCDQLGVRNARLLPDVLMLPLVAEGWSAVRFADQWLFRRDRYAGMVVESSWLDLFLSLTAPPVIESYSVPPAQYPGTDITEWRSQEERDLLQLAAEGDGYDGADLRQGEFARQGTWYAGFRPWRYVAGVMMVCVLLAGANASLAHYRLWQQAEFWRQESVRVYQHLFPGEKAAQDPRRQLLKHLQQSPGDNTPELGSVVRQLQQLLSENSTVRVQALAWDSSSQTLKIDLQAASFQALEQFQQRAEEVYLLQPSEIRQQPHGVESRLILRVNNERA
ncbi:type II secretion system protein GspL [Citrobacter portucalensis]|uniref:type II secretion system protein GspL n=1 Tax=Citrobacter freundii complex TaxID=1344959 RepID=UPI002010FB60|nr:MULTISPECIES: type II secretion system protein GspL [Citrobacter freundii complex]MDQ9159061.1 type II secretion system protein GspL [Citrobacter portucalensis]